MTDDPYRDDPIQRAFDRHEAILLKHKTSLAEISDQIATQEGRTRFLLDRQPTTLGWIGSTLVAATFAWALSMLVLVVGSSPTRPEPHAVLDEARARVTREQDRALCDRTCATAERPTAVAADCSWLPRGRRACACVCRANPSERDPLGGALPQHDETIRITESR